MLQEQVFFRKYGVRMPQQLVSPRISSTDFLEFPKNSVYNFTEVDNVLRGPRTDEYYIRNITGKIPIKHITDLSSAFGNPRRLGLPISSVVREYNNKHRRYSWLREGMVFPTNENKLGIVNFALCSYAYKYSKTTFGDYWYHLNILATIMHQMGVTAKESSRHQYVIFKIPKQLPSIGRLNSFIEKTPQSVARYFNSPELVF